MRIIVTGGGTGGHIYPAIAVAREIKKRKKETEILFVGTRTGIEAKAVPAAGFQIDFIKASGLSFQPVKLTKFIFNNILGLIRAISIMNKFKPDLVIGSGGFVSAPVLAASSLKKVPFVLLEQNALPGKVNRLMARKAEKILATFDETSNYFSNEKTIITGNPIRAEILKYPKKQACKNLNLSPEKFTMVITGGSQGARAVNNAVINSLPCWKEKDWQILHLVGRKNYEEVKDRTEPLMADFKGIYKCLDYTEDMASIYAVADLIISRSGASSLAEITAVGIPAVLIPYPYAADNHQEKNARGIEKAGGAVVIPDNEAEEKLKPTVEELAGSKEKLKIMAEKCKSMGKPQALSNIVDEIEEILSK
ncbi:MAG: undecaprenyldiphospho-muramoylpentapeptide beta-N-acetylglucosaminyltransferase [Vulcanimicrobiota bacterium]